MNPKKEQFRTEPDVTVNERGVKTSHGDMSLTKDAYKEKHGWVSAYPAGHPDHSPMIKPDGK